MSSFVVVLTAFTAFVLLDTFVIPHPYQTVAAAPARPVTAAPVAPPSAGTPPPGLRPKAAPLTYSDADRALTVATYRYADADVYVADITLADPAVLKQAFAHGVYGRNIIATTSAMAAANDAILAINGAFYGAREAGYVVLNGRIYRDRVFTPDQEDLAIMRDGTLRVIREGDIPVRDLVAAGAVDVLTFGPGLVVDGKARVGPVSPGPILDANPRTAIAQVGPLRYLFVVVDGRTPQSAGLTLPQLADFLVGYGATTAYSLDGGGSSAMWFQGRVLNRPTTDGTTFVEREVSDIVYI